MNIEIGTKNMSELTSENLIDIAKIEGVCNHTEHWGNPIITDFTNTMFSDTLVIDFHQERKADKSKGKTIVLYFNFRKFSFHWYFDGSPNESRTSKIKIETFKYLIEKGFNLPLY